MFLVAKQYGPRPKATRQNGVFGEIGFSARGRPGKRPGWVGRKGWGKGTHRELVAPETRLPNYRVLPFHEQHRGPAPSPRLGAGMGASGDMEFAKERTHRWGSGLISSFSSSFFSLSFLKNKLSPSHSIWLFAPLAPIQPPTNALTCRLLPRSALDASQQRRRGRLWGPHL